MKGLLIKDFRLLKMQKTFFLVLAVVAVGMTGASQDATAALGFLPFVISMFSVSTISYDEFDNGNAFLFSLPISRKGYAVEKYCFGLLLGGIGWVFSVLMVLTVQALRGVEWRMETLISALMMLPVMLVLLTVMLPFQLKFGGEKARFAMIGVFGGIFVIGAVMVKIAEAMKVDLFFVLDHLPPISMGMLMAVIYGVAVLGFLISLKISIGIMKKKEF